tara:strand:+ start:3703 stop:4125 length:423 start_codon:yes stop_codon:yes gene_type:complete
MKTKAKPCSQCGKLKFIWKNLGREKLCKNCWSCRSGNKGIKPTTKRISSRSSKRVKLDIDYSKLRIAFLYANPVCAAHLPGCSTSSTDVHHSKGRGKYHLATNTWVALCRSCHSWLELHPIAAKALGFSQNRLVNNEEGD